MIQVMNRVAEVEQTKALITAINQHDERQVPIQSTSLCGAPWPLSRAIVMMARS